MDQASWWEERWHGYLMGGQPPADDPADLRGLKRAQVQMAVSRGRMQAQVLTWRSPAPETVTVQVAPLTEREWRQALDAVAGRPEAVRALLSGRFGAEVAAAWESIGLALLAGAPRSIRCSCRQGATCRHREALALQGGPLLQANPFLWLEALGKSRTQVLAHVRGRLADSSADVALTEQESVRQVDAARFWQAPGDPDAIDFNLNQPPAGDALLRLLGPLPLSPEAGRVLLDAGQTGLTDGVDAVLRRYVQQISQAAAEMAEGTATDRATRLDRATDRERLPGKPVPAGLRLAPEIETAVRTQGSTLLLEELRLACPTAAAMSEPAALRALLDSHRYLSDEFVWLGGRAVAPRGQVLEGAAFRHVITFEEVWTQRLRTDADWYQAVFAVAGFSQLTVAVMPPLLLQCDGTGLEQLFASLNPEIGDELVIRVVDPETPALAITLARWADRNLDPSIQPNAEAARALMAHQAYTGSDLPGGAEAVAALLGAGCYRTAFPPDSAWLLPLLVPALQGERRRAQPAAREEAWADQEEALRAFIDALSPDTVEAAFTCLSWWFRLAPGPQDDTGALPPVSRLLHFLWNLAPVQAAQHGLTSEVIPVVMHAWFAFLTQRYPQLDGVYRPHMAACKWDEPYRRRLQMARQNSAAWLAEGYRWIGPESLDNQTKI